jgi:toxin ParE1/3/4
MAFRVHLTDDAARDLEELSDYIETHDAPDKADYVLGKLGSLFTSLSQGPGRGVYPKELAALGVREFREVFFKPYRVIYRVIEKEVYILLIADGRRDMQTLLERRLLGL